MKRKKFERVSIKTQQRSERSLQDQAGRTCQKRQYRTRAIAQQEAARQSRRLPLRFYLCPECCYWHLTRKRQRSKANPK